MKQKILLVSHCFFNDAAKLRNQDVTKLLKERESKRDFLKKMLNQNVELIQLPCPEFLIYGSNRWGHVSNQFNTPHFRQECRIMLEPIIMQLEEYCAFPDRFDVLGILGIDGSPSCGVNYTCEGDWGGELEDHPSLTSVLSTAFKSTKSGIFMDILKEMLHEKHLPVRLYSLATFKATIEVSDHKDSSQVDLSLYGSDKSEKKSSATGLEGISLL